MPECRDCQNYLEGPAAYNGECEVQNAFFDSHHMQHINLPQSTESCDRFEPSEDYLAQLAEEEAYEATKRGMTAQYVGEKIAPWSKENAA
jgi:hypothetical protein